MTTPNLDDTELFFTEEHVYVMIDGSRAIIGISEPAVENLGDITYIDLPEVGDTLSTGDTLVTIEVGDTSHEFSMPIAGELIAVNAQLEDDPDLLSNSPYGDGWIAEVELDNPEQLAQLMKEADYHAQL